MTICLPPGVSLGNIPAGGVLADSDWYDSDNGAWEPVSFAQKAVNGKIRVRLADLVKLGGPEGYIHGYICVRPPCGPADKEAEFNGRLGEVRHDGVRIGKMRKNEDGTYSMAHTGDNGRVKLTARYATRADAAKSVALYHNVDKLHGEAGSNQAMKDQVAKARTALAAGDDGSAAMFLAQAEANAGFNGNHRLESHIRDTRAAIVDGPRAVSPPDMGGLVFGHSKPVPGLPPKHAPLPDDVKQAVNKHLIALAFRKHNQRIDDQLTGARTAVDAGNGDLAMKHLLAAHDAAFDADDQDVMDHAAAAHDLIAAHLGEPMMYRHGAEAATAGADDHGAGIVPKAPAHGVPPLKLPAGEEPQAPKVPKPRGPVAPRVKRLPKAKADAINAELDTAQNGTGIRFAQAYQTIGRARDAIAAGDLNDAHELLADAHESLAGNPIASSARDHIALADEQLAAHLKMKPFQPRTITHADEHAAAITTAARNLLAANLRIGRQGNFDYLVTKDDVATKLRAGNGAQVIRDLRELDARAREQQNLEWNDERKETIKVARQNATAAKHALEKIHQQDLSEQSFQERATKLAEDATTHYNGLWPIAPQLRLAADELANGDLSNVSKALIKARDAAARQPRVSGARQFEKDITDLHAEVSKALQAQLVAGLGTPAEPSAATGFLGDVENERNRVSAQLVNSIKSGVMSKKAPTVRGFIGETSLVTFGDGSTWVHKSADHADGDKEELASMVAKAVGARAPTVVRDPLDKDSVYMTLVNGKTAAELGTDARQIMAWGVSPEASDGMRKIGFLDYLIRNSDRHNGNFMLGEDSVPVAIDHGNAWSFYDAGSDVTRMVRKNDFTAEYYAQVKQNLEALEPEFTKVAGADNKYYSVMMKQLEKWMKWNDDGSSRPG